MIKYEEWLKGVDKVFLRKYGLTANDVPDYNWRTLFDAGYAPQEAFIDWQDWQDNLEEI